MRTHFKAAVVFLTALFLPLLLSSCAEEGEGAVVSTLNPDGVPYSPNQLNFSTELKDFMSVKSAKVVKLDYDMNPCDTMKVRFFVDSDGGENGFYTDSADFPSPYVKVLLKGEGRRDKHKMTFDILMDITESNYNDPLTFKFALISGRVEELMKQGESFADAKSKGTSELKKALGSNTWPEEWTHILCENFVSDSAFYENFQELHNRLSQGNTDWADMKIQAADDLLDRYDGYEWDGESLYVDWRSKSLSFIDKVYGFDSCRYALLGTFDTIKVEKSKYAGEALLCDEYRTGVFDYEPHWRKVLDIEKDKGACIATSPDTVFFHDSLYYCQYGFWEFEKDQNKANRIKYTKILNEIYGQCGKDLDTKMLRIYNDTLFMCHYQYGSYYDSWVMDSATIARYHGDMEDNAFYIDAEVAVEYGNCTEEREKERVKIGDEFFICDFWALLTSTWQYGWKSINAVAYYAGDCDKDNEDREAEVPTDSTTLSLICKYKPEDPESAYNLLNFYGWVEKTP